MSSHDPFLKADSSRGNRALSRMMFLTSSAATHSLQLIKLLQMSMRFFIYSFLSFLFSRYWVTLKVYPTLLEYPTPFLFFFSTFFSIWPYITCCDICFSEGSYYSSFDSSSKLRGFSPLIMARRSKIRGSNPHYMAVSLNLISFEIVKASERIL